MTSERTRPQFAKAAEWINPLLERGHKIETIDENVEKIRGWVATGFEAQDKYGNTTHRRRMRRRFKDERFTYKMTATSETDPESTEILGYALSLGAVVSQVPSDGKMFLDVMFRYDEPDDPEKVSPYDYEPNLQLYCHIFAHETTHGTEHGTEWRKIPELLPHELDMVYELTNTVAGFIPPPTPEQTP